MKMLILISALLFSCRSPPPPAAAPQLLDTEPKALLTQIEKSPAKVVVLNVWATWCQPCVEELPHFLKVAKKYREKGVELVLLSGDFESERKNAEAFLKKLGVDFTSYRKTGSDEDLINTFSSDWSGTLPATFIYSRGKRVFFAEGLVEEATLEREVLAVLGGGS